MIDRATEMQEEKAKKATELAAAKTEADKKMIQAEIDSIDAKLMALQKSQDRFANTKSPLPDDVLFMP